MLAALALVGGPCFADNLDQELSTAFENLLNWQMDEARAAARKIEQQVKGRDLRYLYFSAMLAYYEGRYAEARDILRSLPDEQRPAAWKELAGRVEIVYAVSQKFQEKASEHFLFRFTPRDEILSHYALDVLEKSYAAVGSDLQFFPSEKVIVEVYPDARSFCAASTLTPEDIEKSGTIAICHSNRIMITSPRVVLNGYTWLDTLCHEYVHYVIIKKTKNAIPVWLHEGIAKFEERRWRSETGCELEPLSASVLAEGLKRNDLVTFEQMHPSLAKLQHEYAALAYAEAVTVIHFLREKYGPDAVVAILDKAGRTRDVPGAISDVTGMSFENFHEKWLAWVRTQRLPVVPGLKTLPPKLKAGVEEEDRDLGNEVNEQAKKFVLIGDLLVQEQLWDAAVVEYEKAIDSSDTISRFISNRVAFVFLAQKQFDRAEDILLRVKNYYPEFQITYANLGRVYASQKRFEEAAQYFEEALRINPFDLFARASLVGVYRKLGRNAEAEGETARVELVKQALYAGQISKH